MRERGEDGRIQHAHVSIRLHADKEEEEIACRLQLAKTELAQQSS